MRICLVSFEFLPRTGFGGAAALYTDLANALAHLGHEVTVLSGNTSKKVEVEARDGVTNIQFGSRLARPRALACLDRARLVFREYTKACKRTGNFDVLESPELLGEPLLVHALRRGPLFATRLITPHYLFHRMNGRRELMTVDWFERTNTRSSNIVLADSEQWGRDILNEWKVDQTRLRMCPLGIDLGRIDRAEKMPIAISGPYILFSGRLTPAKGQQVLAAAAPRILRKNPDAKIVFAGGDTINADGVTMKQAILDSLPSEMRKSLVFLGFVKSWDELVSVYRNAELCVKADSYGNHSFDALGQMACEKALVCSKTEGNSDMIEDGKDGFLFDREDPLQLADVISRLLADPDLRQHIGKNARATIERRFTSKHCAEETQRIFDEAIAAR